MPVVCFVSPAQAVDHQLGGRVIQVSDKRDAVDFAIAGRCRKGDVVVTDDVGLAAIVAAKGADAVSSRGRRFGAAEIPHLLERRHLSRKARRSGKLTPGPRAMTSADRQRFKRTLAELLRNRARPRRPATPTGQKQALGNRTDEGRLDSATENGAEL